MRKFIFLLLLFLFPFSISASCSSSELARYKALANYVDYYYDFDGSNFNVTFYNVSSDFKIINMSNSSVFRSNSGIGDIVVSGIAPGSNISFAAYPASGECSDYRVYTFYISLPYLNKYYQDDVCKNNDNSLCSKWVNTSMYSYDQFVSLVKVNSEEEIITEENEEIVKKYGFFDFLADYYIYILLSIIVLGSAGIYYLNKKDSFDF